MTTLTTPSRLPSRWAELSPLLDEMFDLADAARGERLRALSATDPGLAESLASMMKDATDPAHAGFLDEGIARVAAASPGLIGKRIGPYLIDAELGEGGTSSVWRAHHVRGSTDRPVAIKLLHLSFLGRTGAARFDREKAILGRLAHPNVARLLDAGTTPHGQPYLAIEYVDGKRIDRYCDAKRLDVRSRLRLLRLVMDGAKHVHEQQIVHRDLKPNNILVTDDGVVKLLDLGIAKPLRSPEGRDDLTIAGQMPMTPRYAAPEQLRGAAVTAATDVYALGVLMYRLLCGRHPTTPDVSNAAEVIESALTRKPLRMNAAAARTDLIDEDAPEVIAANRSTSLAALHRELSRELDAIVAKALRKDPAARHESVAAFAAEIDRWLDRRHGAARSRRSASTRAESVASAIARPFAIGLSGVFALVAVIWHSANPISIACPTSGEP